MKKLFYGFYIIILGLGVNEVIAGPTNPEEVKDLVLVENKNPQGAEAIPDKLDDNSASRLGTIASALYYDVKRLPIVRSNKLGIINSERKLKIPVPNKPGEIMVYSFIPTQGEIARRRNKELYIAFENVVHKAGTPLAKGTTLNVYLQYEGDKPQDWRKFETLHVPLKKFHFNPAEVTIRPDAVVLIKNIKGEDDIFDLAKMKRIK